MNSAEWERARYKAYQEVYWDQTQGDAFRFDFSALAREVDARVPPSAFTDPIGKVKGRIVDVQVSWSCPFCSRVLTSGSGRRWHLRRHLENGKAA